MKANLALRLRNSVDHTNITYDNKYSAHVNGQPSVLSPRKSVHKPSIHQIYKVTQLQKMKQSSKQPAQEFNGRQIRYNNSIDISLEDRKKIQTLEKTLFCSIDNRSIPDDKTINPKLLKEDSSKLENYDLNQSKRHSLPSLYKKQSPLHYNPDKSTIPSLPPIQEITNLQQMNYSIDKYLGEVDKLKLKEQKEVTQSTERILDLLMLKTCDLKKVFRNQNQKNNKKIFVKRKIPSDFFNILNQF